MLKKRIHPVTFSFCRVLIAANLFYTSVYSHAQQVGYSEEVLITGSRLEVTAAELPSSSYQITNDEIQQRAKRSSIDLIRTIPGIQIGQQGGAGGVSVLYMRGGEPNFTTVMIDGVVVNDPANSRGGSFDFAALEVARIEQIEVVNGPQSALYGSGSLAGTINIITESGGDQPSNRIRAEIGNNGYYHSNIITTGPVGKGHYSFNLGRLDAGEQTPGSKFDNRYLGGKLTHGVLGADMLLAFRYADASRTSFPEDSGGPQFAVLRELDTEDLEDFSATWRLDWELGMQASSYANISWFSRETDFLSPGIVAPINGIPARGDKTKYRRTEIDTGIAWKPGDLEIAAAVNAQLEDGEDDGFVFFEFLETDFSLKRETFGGVLEARLALLDNLVVSSGIRYDLPDKGSNEFNSALGVVWNSSETGPTLYASYSTGFKLPSFFALGNALVGNPDLLPEESKTWQLGLRQVFIENTLQTTLEIFSSEYKNLIDLDEQLFLNVNRALVESQGADLSVAFSSRDKRIRARSFISYLDLDVVSSEDVLRGRPQWHAGASLYYRFSDRFDANIDYIWNDTTIEAALPFESVTNPSGLVALSPYQRVDLSLQYQFSKRLSLLFSIDNLLDEDYQEAVGFSAPGIEPRIGFSYELFK